MDIKTPQAFPGHRSAYVVTAIGSLKDLKPNHEIEIREIKTKKLRRVTLNKACIDTIRNLLASAPFKDSDYLFQGQRAEVLIVFSVVRLVKQWCKAIYLGGNFGSHTLRKTWGYHQRVTFGTDLPRLMVCFNQSTQRQTLE